MTPATPTTRIAGSEHSRIDGEQSPAGAGMRWTGQRVDLSEKRWHNQAGSGTAGVNYLIPSKLNSKKFRVGGFTGRSQRTLEPQFVGNTRTFYYRLKSVEYLTRSIFSTERNGRMSAELERNIQAVRSIEVERKLNEELGVALMRGEYFVACSHWDGERIERKVWNALIAARLNQSKPDPIVAADMAYRATLGATQDEEAAQAVKEFMLMNLAEAGA